MRRAYLIIILCICFMLAACNSEEPEPVEITFIHGWGSTEEDHQTMRSIYKDFEKEHPGIRLNMLSIPTNDEMMETVKDMLTVGNIPNVIFTAGEGENNIYRYMLEKDMLVDMLPFIDEDESFKDSVSPIIRDMWMKDAHLYTVSDVLIVSGGYWYNKKIIEKAGIENMPATWNEFYGMLAKIDAWASSVSPTIETIRPSTEAYLYMADSILYARGEQLIKGSMDVSGDSFDRVCTMWSRVYDNVHISGRNHSYRDETELFNDGRLAIYTNGVWAASMIDDDIDVGYALLPSDSGETVGCQTAGLGYLVGNVKNQAQIDASMEFIKYMCSLPVQIRILTETQQVPQNPNVNIFDYSTTLGRFCQAVGEVQNADISLDVPRNLWSDNQWSILDSSLQKYLEGDISVEMFYNSCIGK